MANNFLQAHLESAQVQKMRLEKAIVKKDEQLTISYERSIDQGALVKKLESAILAGSIGVTVADVAAAKDRLVKDKKNHEHYQKEVNKDRNTIRALISEIDTHGSELSDQQISVSGFFKPVPVIYNGGEYDKKDENKIILSSSKENYVEYAKPLRKDRWNETFLLTVRKGEDGGKK